MRRHIWSAIFLTVMVVACGSQAVAPSTAPPSSVGPTGGVVSNDGASLSIPADALPSAVAVDIKRLDPSTTSALPAATAPGIEGTAELSSDIFAFTPHGTTFAKPVAVEIAHTGSGNAVLRLDDENDKTWELVPDTTFANGVARFQVTRFSIYAIAAAKRECQRRACKTLPEAIQCGKVDDGCGGQIDVHADCGLPACKCGADNRCTACTSTFDCATTTAECGVEVDNCGTSHDVLAECPKKPGCGSKGSCTNLNLCGPCTPYATCEEALAADDNGECNPQTPDGCGGTMDCASSICTGGKQCMQDSFSGFRECAVPCSTWEECPSGTSTCTDSTHFTESFPICQDGRCHMAGHAGQCTDGQGNVTQCVGGYCEK